MLALPQKPWKRVRITPLGADRYTVTFVSPLDSEAAFDAAVTEDLAACLGSGDELTDPSWPARSVTLTTRSLPAFERRLVLESIAVEPE